MNTKGLFFCGLLGVLIISINTSIFCMENGIDKDENVDQLIELIIPWLGKQLLVEESRTEAKEKKVPVMIELDETTKAICNSGDDITLYLDNKSETLGYLLFYKTLSSIQDGTLHQKEKMAGNLARPPQSNWWCIAS